MNIVVEASTVESLSTNSSRPGEMVHTKSNSHY